MCCSVCLFVCVLSASFVVVRCLLLLAAVWCCLRLLVFDVRCAMLLCVAVRWSMRVAVVFVVRDGSLFGLWRGFFSVVCCCR